MKHVKSNEVFFLIKPFGFYKKLIVNKLCGPNICNKCYFAEGKLCNNNIIYCHYSDYFVKSSLIEYLKYKLKL